MQKQKQKSGHSQAAALLHAEVELRAKSRSARRLGDEGLGFQYEPCRISLAATPLKPRASRLRP